MSSVQDQFSAQEIQALLAGETVTTSKVAKTKSTQVESHPDAAKSIAYTPSTSVSITKVSKVTAPNVRDEQGKVVSEAGVLVTPNFSEDSEVSKRDRARREAARAAEAAKAELAHVADPVQLLNTLNGLRRIVEKQGKEITALKKESKK